MKKIFRQATIREEEILSQFFALNFPGNKELRKQLSGILARTTVEDNDNYGSIEIKTDSGPIAHVTQRVPVEARAYDEDGVPIDCLLHIVDGRLKELEFFKVDGTRIQKHPIPEEFTYKVR